MTNKWNYQPLTNQQKEQADALHAHCGGNSAIAEVLLRRGVKSPAEADAFFTPAISDLHDPFLMPDMDKAVNRLNKAMGAKERIMIYGDYDVDGTTAVALVYKYLQNYYSNIEYYIPTRYEEGYGISLKSIDYALENDVKLVIVLDCGIKAIDEIAYAKEHGIDFIICDHHVPDETLPPAVAILNPKMPGSAYPCHHLSGCGVGFKFMQAFAQSNGLSNHNELESLLDLVAVSIAADIVPIIDENRIMAYHGLKRLTELYYKPAVVLTFSNGLATGSSRSVQGFDIYSAVNSTRDLLENFGGHTYAVGLSLREENIPEFSRRFEEYVASHIQPNQLSPQIDIDAVIEFADITPELTGYLKKLNPYGPGNQKPVFCTRNVFDFGTSKLVGKNLEHIKLELEDDSTSRVINAIAFNMAPYFEHIHAHKPIDICYTIEQTKQGGHQESIQLMIRDIRLSEQK